jgi:hypothetical protein
MNDDIAHYLRFHVAAGKLLFPELNGQIPIADVGYLDDPYLNEADYTLLGTIVCRELQGVTLTDWWQSDSLRRAVMLEQVLAGREDTAAKVSSERPSKATSIDARALALFIENRNLSKTEIAARLGLNNVQSLAPNRCPKLHLAIQAWRASELPRGSVNENGTIEAVAERDDDD